jgi:choline kinase
MDAILYVAGRAHRLGTALTKGHKVLLEFGGKSLLERHVMLLEQMGVKKLHVVTGHGRTHMQQAIADLATRYKLEIRELYNADFMEGSVISMQVSIPVLEQIREPVLLMDGDVLYDIRMLERLVHSKQQSVLLVDQNYSTADDDPVLVPMRGGKPFDFVKKWKGEAETIGESIGFFKMATEDVRGLIQETRERSARSRTDSYDDVLRALVQRGVFGAEDVTGLPWTEVDFPQDIEYAEKVILPSLR